MTAGKMLMLFGTLIVGRMTGVEVLAHDLATAVE
ncbi:hypothetical protein ACVWXS_005084 [Lysinibacillus sp. TE18511]